MNRHMQVFMIPNAKYGYYRSNLAEQFGIVIWCTKEGKEVILTHVDDVPYKLGYICPVDRFVRRESYGAVGDHHLQ